MIRRAALALVLLLVLAGCNAAARVVVHPDGSGTYAMTVTVPSGGDSVYRAMQQALAKSKVPLRVSPYTAGTETGGEASFAFRSLADLKAETDQLAGLGGGLNGVSVSRTGTGWQFSAVSSNSLTAAPHPQASGPTGGNITTGALTAVLHVSASVQLPGAPAETNATTVTHDASTSTFTWVLDGKQTIGSLQASTTFVGDQLTVHLASGLTKLSGRNGSGHAGGWLWVVAVAVLAGLAGALAVGLIVALGPRRRSGEPPAEERVPAGV